MPNTYGNIYVQVVFAVKFRQNLIANSWKDELYKYMSGILTRKGVKSLIVNGMPDHVHLFFSIKSNVVVSDLIRDVKNNSTNFINKNNFLPKKFQWQEGYGYFSYSKWDVDKIYNYVLNQEAHHQQKSFKNEYLDLLTQNEVEFENRFLFEWIE